MVGKEKPVCNTSYIHADLKHWYLQTGKIQHMLNIHAAEILEERDKLYVVFRNCWRVLTYFNLWRSACEAYNPDSKRSLRIFHWVAQ